MAGRITTVAAITAIGEVLSHTREHPPAVSASTRLISLGLSSLEVAEIFILLEDLTGCVVGRDALVGLTTVDDFRRLECLDIAQGETADVPPRAVRPPSGPAA